MAITFIPFATAKIQLKPPLTIEAGPMGTRNVFEVATAEFNVTPKNHDSFTMSLTGVAADWMLVSPEGAATLDIRGTLQTDDGAIVYVNYYGKADLSKGLVFPVTIYVAPRFEASAPRYSWLNTLQIVGKGTVDENLLLDYEWYEMV